MTVDVISEPRTYGQGSENSYFLDLARSVTNHPGAHEARQRLNRHAIEIETDAASPRSAAQKRAQNVLREVNRASAPETRALTSATNSGGAFVSPQYLTESWAQFRTPEPIFSNQTTLLPLPEYGLTVNIPTFTSAASVTQQTEGSTVSDQDPSGTAASATVVPLVGEITVTQQWWDRAGATGAAADQILYSQMLAQFNTAKDSYVLNQALANAASVSDSNTWSASVFYRDISLAAEQMTDTVGVRLNPTHVFSTSDYFRYVSRQLDSQSRPLIVPDSAALAAIDSDPTWAGYTGVHLPGALQWHQDDNIPAISSNTQIIVCRPREIYTFDADHFTFAYPETKANQLEVIVGIKGYVGAVVRFPKAIAVISGSTYPTSLI